MEIRLKERLVGAMVLVIAAVIFIPMVLDGPNPNRRVSQSVALPDPDAETRRTVRLSLDPQPAGGAGARESPAESARESAVQSGEPVSVDLVPAQEQVAAIEPHEPVAVAPSAREPALQKPPVQDEQPAADDTWTVQAGSFSRDDNAETLAAKLRKLGYPAYVSRYNDGKRTHYRVRVGGFPSRDAAQLKADEIRAKTGEPAAPVQSR